MLAVKELQILDKISLKTTQFTNELKRLHDVILGDQTIRKILYEYGLRACTCQFFDAAILKWAQDLVNWCYKNGIS